MAAAISITCLALVLSFSLNILAQDEFTIVVDVPVLGPIQGNAANTARDVKPYWAFHGIPYALPESYTGANRFQPSKLYDVPLTNNGSTFIANRIRVFCPQNAILDIPADKIQDIPSVLGGAAKTRRHILKTIREAGSTEEIKNEISNYWGQEDCLTINVNTPKIPETEDEPLLPVILFIHGGGSDSIFGSVFMGLRLMDYPVVLVTINYRLGTLGSFNLGIDDAPGCQAMYDAVVALEWIQAYIKSFGGDPNQVTITGQSAGAMMISHLVLSPMAAGLFHGAWGFSGSALNMWATFDERAIKHHLEVAHFAGCYNRETQLPSDYTVVTECMQGLAFADIIAAQNLYMAQETSSGRLGFDGKGPATIQSPGITHRKFMSESPTEILKAGKQSPVPLVLGATRHDGSYPLDDIYNEYLLPSGQLDNATYVQNYLIRELLTTFGVTDVTGGVYHSMIKTYLGDAANTADFDSKIPGLIDISTVFGFKGGEYKVLEYHSRVQPKSYFYSFDYKGRWTLYNLLWGLDKKIPGGICHTDELMYIFYFFPLLNDDMKVSRRFLDYFVNFATHGDPNGVATLENPKRVIWPEYDPIDHTFLIMNRTDRIGEQCPDTWIGAALELMKPDIDEPVDPTGPTTELPVETSTSPTTPSVTPPTNPTTPSVTPPASPTTPSVTPPASPTPPPTSRPTTPSGSKSLGASFSIILGTLLSGIIAMYL